MRIGLAVAAAFIASPLIAAAAPSMSDSQFLRASRCAALATVPQLKSEADMSWLMQQVKQESRYRPEIINQRADDERDQIARTAKHATTEADLAGLKARRDEACAGMDKQAAKL